jgi:hypothetical protein
MEPMPAQCVDSTNIQATLFDFAIGELVRQHRASFEPLWTSESWAKLLIWLALNCGCSGDETGLTAFAEALGPVLSGRLRRIFFERELHDLGLQVMADPAEQQVLVLPLDGGTDMAGEANTLMQERVAAALERLELQPLVAEAGRWQKLEALVAIPWRERS